MHIVESWLKQYTSYRIPPETLAERLTMLGLEFESITRPGDRYNGFIVGKVLEVNKHPKADRLTVCMVDTGKETLQVVCGAPNVAAGQKVPLGLPGAVVPRNQHDPEGRPFTLARVAVRGVESHGMICSAYELDLGTDADGIMVLPSSARIGETLATHLGLNDVIYDIEITPNRPDWLSHIGFAREIGVLTGKAPKLPRFSLKERGPAITKSLSVAVKDNQNCVRFAARMVRDVKIGPSPQWLQDWLTKAGLRPRNNVVDITNFVMLEFGQPMHAFDYALLKGSQIIVRQAGEQKKFTTLDGKEHDLPADTVMVCDAEREVSVAGVMGGANSEISDATVDVVLESACWNPSSIRRTAKALGISSDASQRYERGADPNIVRVALDRAADLVVRLAGGILLKGVIDVYPRPVRARRITLRPERANQVLGTSLTGAQMTRYLAPLGVRRAARKGKNFTFDIPTFRVDLEREIDLIEEVARVHGYDNIEEKTTATIDFVHPFAQADPSTRVRDTLIGLGFHEVITNSMQDEKRALVGSDVPVRILNPQNQEMQYLRSSLVPGVLDVIFRNKNFGNTDLRVFEIGHVFARSGPGENVVVEGFAEEARVAVAVTGAAAPRHWQGDARMSDLFDMKGEITSLLRSLGLDKWRLISYSTPRGLTENPTGVEIQGTYAGYFGRVRDESAGAYGIEQEVFVAELSLTPLTVRKQSAFVPLPKFLKVRRDVAFLLNTDTEAQQVEQVIRKAAGELLHRVDVFDVYEGEKVGPGKKSVAFALELLPATKTLTEKEIDDVIRRVVAEVERECQAILRSAT
jgi:phenylalanyl-tRNA synthetase beta chain